MFKKIILSVLLSTSSLIIFSQNDQEDESKMLREVINVQVERAKFSSPPAAAPAPPVNLAGKNGKKKNDPPPPAPADLTPDTSSPLIPAPVSEIDKRAQNWSVDKPLKYTKSNCSNNGTSVVCQISFPYKVKELNPSDLVEGEITMNVSIEAKEGKYRYTITKIKHKASAVGVSGGDVYAPVPECGSLKLTDLSWKHIKSAALIDAQLIADELKARMARPSGDSIQKDEW